MEMKVCQLIKTLVLYTCIVVLSMLCVYKKNRARSHYKLLTWENQVFCRKPVHQRLNAKYVVFQLERILDHKTGFGV